MMARGWWLGAAASLAIAAATVACSTTTAPAPAAGLMVVVSGDLMPSEYDELRVEVSQQEASGPWRSWLDLSKVVPSEATLPTTVFVEAGHSPDQEVDVRVTAYLAGVPIVLRQAQLQAPTNRVATLYFVLAEACKGQVRATGAEGEPESTCPDGESCQPGTGTCGSNVIATSTLPTFAPGQSLDAGGDAGLFAGAPLSDGGPSSEEESSEEAPSSEAGPSPEGGPSSEAGPPSQGDGGDADASEEPTCANSCSQGQTLCVSGGLATCSQGSKGCWAYGAPVACPSTHQGCTGSVGSAACTCNPSSVCTALGSTCENTSTQAICQQDSQGCFFEATASSCIDGACSAGACCANACTSAATACSPSSSTAIESCATGSNGCTAWTSSSCASGLVCERYASPACINPNWAEWPMPNVQVDVAAGAPNPDGYTDNGDGTVTDKPTALVWQQTAPSSSAATQAAAVQYCATLTLAGYTDWRLPSFVELVSLLDFGVSSPTINTTYFPNAPATFFWSSTPYAGQAGSYWDVHFDGGYTFGDSGSSSGFYARCVR